MDALYIGLILLFAVIVIIAIAACLKRVGHKCCSVVQNCKTLIKQRNQPSQLELKSKKSSKLKNPFLNIRQQYSLTPVREKTKTAPTAREDRSNDMLSGLLKPATPLLDGLKASREDKLNLLIKKASLLSVQPSMANNVHEQTEVSTSSIIDNVVSLATECSVALAPAETSSDDTDAESIDADTECRVSVKNESSIQPPASNELIVQIEVSEVDAVDLTDNSGPIYVGTTSEIRESALQQQHPAPATLTSASVIAQKHQKSNYDSSLPHGYVKNMKQSISASLRRNSTFVPSCNGNNNLINEFDTSKNNGIQMKRSTTTAGFSQQRSDPRSLNHFRSQRRKSIALDGINDRDQLIAGILLQQSVNTEAKKQQIPGSLIPNKLVKHPLHALTSREKNYKNKITSQKHYPSSILLKKSNTDNELHDLDTSLLSEQSCNENGVKFQNNGSTFVSPGHSTTSSDSQNLGAQFQVDIDTDGDIDADTEHEDTADEAYKMKLAKYNHVLQLLTQTLLSNSGSSKVRARSGSPRQLLLDTTTLMLSNANTTPDNQESKCCSCGCHLQSLCMIDPQSLVIMQTMLPMMLHENRKLKRGRTNQHSKSASALHSKEQDSAHLQVIDSRHEIRRNSSSGRPSRSVDKNSSFRFVGPRDDSSTSDSQVSHNANALSVNGQSQSRSCSRNNRLAAEKRRRMAEGKKCSCISRTTDDSLFHRAGPNVILGQTIWQDSSVFGTSGTLT